jgi:hypothetical protein
LSVKKRHHIRQLELLALSSREGIPALPEDALREVREALQKLLVEVVVAERGLQERCDEQDHT